MKKAKPDTDTKDEVGGVPDTLQKFPGNIVLCSYLPNRWECSAGEVKSERFDSPEEAIRDLESKLAERNNVPA